MIIRCHGARGSIPVSGRQYLQYGGDTTCIEIRTADDQIVIIDAGTGIRRLGNMLIEEGRFEYTMLFTHTHMDHISGFPFFKPIYNEKTVIHLKGCPAAQGNIRKLLSRSMQAPFFPVPFDKLRAQVDFDPECYISLQIGTMEVEFITLSHPNLGSGYRFTENGRRFVFLTDNELGHRHRGGRTFKEYAKFTQGADLLFHDAEYTPEEYRLTKSWGHSTYTEALDLALAAGVKSFGLFHHNQDRTDRELNILVRKCRKIIETRGSGTDCFAVSNSFEKEL